MDNPIVETFIQGTIVNIELIKLSELNTLKITSLDIYNHYHFESNFEQVLKFKNNKIITGAYYETTNQKKS